MIHQLAEGRLVAASHNRGKVQEIADLLAPFAVEVTAAEALGLPEPVESGTTFAANAAIKALTAATVAGFPALADDSGLAVTALNNAPGLYSARWAGPGRDFTVAMARVNAALGGADNRSARFVCALALAWPDGYTDIFEGTVEGTLVWPPRGDKGFGYDPIFQPTGYALTFAEMLPEIKHAISHRGDAFRRLIAAYLNGRG